MVKQKILVIEDEIRDRNLFISCLRAEGYDTLIADNGVVGCQIAQQELPDLILCDIIMPKLDGYGVLTQLQQNINTAMIPFVFLTAKGSKLELRRGMNLGADDYLTKPLTVEELIEAVSARLVKRSLQDNRDTEKEKPPSASIANATTTEVKIAQAFFPAIPQLSQVFQFIEANYNRGISLNDVAQEVGYSPAYLTNLVGKQTGKTIVRWIIERRMVEACHLLQETSDSIENIARKIGYQDACHFSRQFRQYWQTTPQTWRKSVKAKC
ncbi:MAG TPA: response regulator [Xenococcaceae cyanobacterium]